VDGGYLISNPTQGYDFAFDEATGKIVQGHNTAESSTVWNVACGPPPKGVNKNYLCGIYHGNPSDKKCAVYATGGIEISECDPLRMTASQVCPRSIPNI
jgi:hypothetical protein